MNVTPELLEEITRQVLAAVAGTAAPTAGPSALKVGGGCAPSVPGFRWADESEYKGDVSPYAMVFCAGVSGAQLCDMAMGRDTTPAACAVSKALLAGKPVYLAEEGLPHRACQSTANPRYYAMLEDYVTRLTQFGVRVAPRAELEQIMGAVSAPAAPAPVAAVPVASAPCCKEEAFSGVLTAEKARQLARTCNGTLCLAPDAILTPLARDVLREKKITVVREGEQAC